MRQHVFALRKNLLQIFCQTTWGKEFVERIIYNADGFVDSPFMVSVLDQENPITRTMQFFFHTVTQLFVVLLLFPL